MDVVFTLYAFPKRAEGCYALYMCRPEVDSDESSLTIDTCLWFDRFGRLYYHFWGKKVLEVGWDESDVYRVQQIRLPP